MLTPLWQTVITHIAGGCDAQPDMCRMDACSPGVAADQ